MANNTPTIQTLNELFAKFPLRVSLSKQAELMTLVPVVCARNRDASFRASDIPAWDEFCSISLRERLIDYKKKRFGDCGTQTKVDVSKLASGLKFAGLGAGGAATVASVTGATVGLTAGLTLATAGIGLIAAPIIGILTAHSVAVATEQGTLCAVSTAFNSTLPAIDEAVASGQLNVEQGEMALAQLVDEMKRGLEPIRKPCNFACGVIAVLNAQIDFARSLYPELAPAIGGISIPGAPDAVNETAQAGVNQANALFDAARAKLQNPALLAGIAIAGVSAIVLFAIGRR